MEIWTSDSFSIDYGVIAEAVKTGKKNRDGKDLYKMSKRDNCHLPDDLYKIALYRDGITPQTEKYTSLNEITSPLYPKSGVAVNIDIINPTGKRAQIIFKDSINIEVSAKYGILYNASKQGRVLLIYRFSGNESVNIPKTNIYT